MAHRGASNGAGRTDWERFEPLVRCAVEVAVGGEPLGGLLRRLVLACGAERGFVVSGRAGSDGDYRLLGGFSIRPDGPGRLPSRTAALRALSQTRPTLFLDAARELADRSASVRSLALRTIVAAPLPCGDASRPAALLLDSRRPPELSRAGLEAVATTFAALLALALASKPTSDATASGDSLRQSSEDGSLGTTQSWIARVAASSLPVLIRGESGSGKERIATAIHERSPRRGGPFVAVNCGAIAESLLESELFGCIRGAFTGAVDDRPGLFRQANGGTLFLDEVADMPEPMQAKLLRVLETGRVRPVGGAADQLADARIVAASHRDLETEVRRRRFRADLYYRLAVLPIVVPPLRERLDEIPELVRSLGPRLERETGLSPLRLAPDAWLRLRAYSWPGNVRELHSVLARALLRSGGAPIDATHLGALGGVAPPAESDICLEQRMIESALEASAGNLASAARCIGWTRQKLYRRMKVLGLPRS